MSNFSEVTEQARAAKTVQQMIQSVEKLRGLQTAKAIPLLADLDQRAPGWIRILIFGGSRILVTAAILSGIFILLRWGAPLLIWPAATFTETNLYGQWAIRWGGSPPPPGLQLIGAHLRPWGWLAVIVVVGFVLFRSEGVRRTLSNLELWTGEGAPGSFLRVSLLVMLTFAQALFLLATGLFVFFSLLPLVFVALDLLASLAGWWELREVYANFIQAYWPWALGGLVLLGLLMNKLRKTPREELIRPALIIFGSAGLVDLFWNAYLRGLSYELIMAGLGLVLVYPAGLAMPVARLFFVPFYIFRDTLEWTAQRVNLRWKLGVALRAQRERNRKQTGGDTWATVCQKHLRRFETRYEPISYFRRIAYGSCPVCQDDDQVYTGVECLALRFDKSMSEPVKQAGPALLFNGLNWLEKPDPGRLPVFDAVVVQEVDDHDMEKFVTEYQNQNLRPPHKSLREVTAQIEKGCTLPDNQLRILESAVSRVLHDYDPDFSPNPFTGNLRVRESVQQGARLARQAVWRLVKISLLLSAAALALAVLAPRARAFWPEVLDYWSEVFVQNPRTEATITVRQVSVQASATQPPTETTEPAAVEIEPLVVSILISEVDQMPLILIPAGAFEMGNLEERQAPDALDEYPSHTVYLDAFYIDRHEITNDQYHLCVYAGACDPPQSPASQTSDNYYEKTGFKNNPVIKVRWLDAQAYCSWAGRRLPTEAEWEKAARWDPEINQSYTYPWGEDPPDEASANFGKLAGDTTAAGSYPAGNSPLGVEDLAGNVWEWVSDWYAPEYYSQSPERNPSGPEEGVYKTMRGGSWASPAVELRTTARKQYAPQESRFDTGFRCAMDLPGK
jgi:formylglycine-generating enzyme required for sulfatase activity